MSDRDPDIDAGFDSPDGPFSAELEQLIGALYPPRDQRLDDELGDKPVSDLSEAEVDPESKVRTYKDRIDDEEAKRHEQANRLRVPFFWFGIVLASVCVATSGVISVWGTVGGSQLAAPAMVAFISGLSVQTIGILWVIARYLFTPPHKTKPETPED